MPSAYGRQGIVSKNAKSGGKALNPAGPSEANARHNQLSQWGGKMINDFETDVHQCIYYILKCKFVK